MDRILFAVVLLLALQPRLVTWVARRRTATAGGAPNPTSPFVHAGVGVSSAYASYLGAGVGVFLLAIFGILLDDDIQTLNGLRNVLILVANIVGLLLFVFSGRWTGRPRCC